MWSCLGCCLLLGSLQHAEADRAHRYACFDVLSELVSLRAHGRPLLHPSDSTFARAANRCEAATQDRPRSFYLFNIFSGPHTVRMSLLPVHACATLHVCACRYMRSRPTTRIHFTGFNVVGHRGPCKWSSRRSRMTVARCILTSGATAVVTVVSQRPLELRWACHVGWDPYTDPSVIVAFNSV